MAAKAIWLNMKLEGTKEVRAQFAMMEAQVSRLSAALLAAGVAQHHVEQIRDGLDA